MKAFHGTSLKNAIAILNGSTDKDTGIWSVSDSDGAFYFYPVNKLADDLGVDVDDEDEQSYLLEHAVNQAKWHGQAATCHAAMTETDFVVLEMEIPDELMEDDFSCPGMSDIASYISIDDLRCVTFEAFHVGSLSVYHRPFVLSGVVCNDECFTDSEIDPDLMTMAHMVLHGGDFSEVFERINEAETVKMSKDEFMTAYAPR